MTAAPSTRASLLLRLRDPQDHRTWAEFVTLYEPVIYRLLRRHGLQDSDAREIMQELFLAVSGNIDRWVIGCEAPTEESFDAWRKLVVGEFDRLGQPGGLDEMDLRSYCDELEEFFQSDLNKEELPPDVTRTMARGNIELQRLRMEIVAGDFDQLLTKMKAVSPAAAAAAARKWLTADRACIIEVVPEDTK